MPNDVDEYFTADDPAFSERLNTPMILTEIFAMKPVVKLPQDFKNGVYPNNENKRKANFSILYLINVSCNNTGDGFTANADNQGFTLRVYPNFHNFKWWNSVTWTGTGDINLQMKDAKTGAVLINNINNGVNLNSYNIPRKQVDLIFTLSNGARVTNIRFEFQNNPKNTDMDWQIPLANIQGLVTKLAEKATKAELEAQLNKIYYIGKIEHIAVDKTPSELDLPGTWEQMKGRFLLGSDGSIYPLGSKAGSSTHILNNDEMPNHTHLQNSHTHEQNKHRHKVKGYMPDYPTEFYDVKVSGIGRALTALGDYYYALGARGTDPIIGEDVTATNKSTTATNQNTGGGGAHNNMPPYEVVHIWKRIS